MKIGDRIRELRTAAKMGQKELAVRLGISASAVGMYEQNRREPDDRTKIAICMTFNVSPSYLLGWDDKPSEYVPLPTEGLTDEERKLLEKFRGLSDERKAIAIQLLDPLAENR